MKPISLPLHGEEEWNFVLGYRLGSAAFSLFHEWNHITFHVISILASLQILIQ